MLVSHKNKTAVMLVSQTSPMRVQSTSLLLLSFVAINFHEFLYICINLHKFLKFEQLLSTLVKPSLSWCFVFCVLVFVMSIRKKVNVSDLYYKPAGHAMHSPWVPPYVPRGQGKQVVRFLLPTWEVQENPGVDTRISKLILLGRSYLTGSLDGALWYE